jgi:hypothetical protein
MVRGAPGEYEADPEGPKRGYTTRAKEEQRRTAAPAFTGLVRRWVKRWAHSGHLIVLRWERAHPMAQEHTTEAESEESEASSMQIDEQPKKRPRH